LSDAAASDRWPAALWLAAKTWLEPALAFLYPDACQICRSRSASADQGYVCAQCRLGPDGVKRITHPFCARCGLPYEGEISGPFRCANCRDFPLEFDWARSAAVARGVVLEVIHRYKYGRAVWFEPFLAGLLVEAAGPGLRTGPGALIVPVPLHPFKEREREFNQAQRLGRRLAEATGAELNTRAVRRVKRTEAQAQLARKERLENVQEAFAVRPDADVRRRRVVLIDDVLTTGATTSACAAALKRAGASEVGVWTVARGVISP
jgi:ComF family protein